MAEQQFSETEIRILQVLEDSGAIRGNMLMRKTGIDRNQMVDSVQKLMTKRLVAASGGVDSKEISKAYLSLVPSTRGIAKKAMETF